MLQSNIWLVNKLQNYSPCQVDFTTLLSQDIMIKLNAHFKKIRETGPGTPDEFTFKEYIDQSEVSACCHDNTCCHGEQEKNFLKSAALIFLQVLSLSLCSTCFFILNHKSYFCCQLLPVVS